VLALYEAMNVTTDVSMNARLPVIQADTALLRQVIHNLMQNSLDALTGIDDPRLRLTTESADGGVRFVVEDNGAGIRDDMLNRIFEPYVTTKTKGTGLGLAIVKKIVEEHGGEVSIANVKPHGARVAIWLPLAARGPGTEANQ
jgi:nitrogen fixation/metabolism regulation signal transduction histidine kinase